MGKIPSLAGTPLGEVIPPFVRAVSQDTFWQYAVGSLDYNPVHLNSQWVSRNPVLGATTVGHGMMSMSFLASAVMNWAAPAGGRIKRLKVRFLRPVRPGDTITSQGVVKERHFGPQGKNYLLIELVAANQHNEVNTTGFAEVYLP